MDDTLPRQVSIPAEPAAVPDSVLSVRADLNRQAQCAEHLLGAFAFVIVTLLFPGICAHAF